MKWNVPHKTCCARLYKIKPFMFSNPFKRAPEEAEAPPHATETETEIAMPEIPTVEPQPELVAAPIDAPEPNEDKGSEPQVVKPLFVGAFLNGELEIVEIIERGPINFYRANAGGGGENDWKWVWERAATSTEPTVPPGDEEFFAPATRFVQEEREYAVYEWDEREPFSNWRSSANDDTFLMLIAPLARALGALQNAHLQARIAPESLYFLEDELRYFGFFDADETGQSNALASLAELSSTLAKAHLAPRATLRLDDVWAALPFSVELKSWARDLENGAFSSVEAAAGALERFAAPTQTQIHVQTDVGLERDHNEDGVLSLSLNRASQNGATSVELLAVADGMGGHEAGEVASQTALDTLQMALLKRQNANWNDNFELLQLGRELIEEVNAAVIRQNENPPFASMRQKPGTTLVFVLRVGRRLLVGNVGDSRLYRWSQTRGLEPLTKDHSYVQDLLDAGKLRPDEAWNHPDGSIITSHIGMTRGLLSDVSLHLVAPGDRVFLVSDGVVDTLRDAQIEEVVMLSGDAISLCSKLVDAANDAGGVDNISVAAMFCE